MYTEKPATHKSTPLRSDQPLLVAVWSWLDLFESSRPHTDFCPLKHKHTHTYVPSILSRSSQPRSPVAFRSARAQGHSYLSVKRGWGRLLSSFSSNFEVQPGSRCVPTYTINCSLIWHSERGKAEIRKREMERRGEWWLVRDCRGHWRNQRLCSTALSDTRRFATVIQQMLENRGQH